ncbi:hypothetical protein R3P38DRAFT_3193535 [Favolaschia claudopus]|uniref:Uncharacterized protein n=1 Tax=Favolaschia claudopus TaxID=2862362 RepID=A0AAW0BJ71_9AGAR
MWSEVARFLSKKKNSNGLQKGRKKLESRPLGDREYQTNISRWTCSCGQQQYNALLLSFFREVVRRRTIPFYHHPLLKPKDGLVVDPIENLSISNGYAVEPATSADAAAALRGVKRKRTTASTSTVAEGSSSGGTGSMNNPIQLSSSPVSPHQEKAKST